MQRICLGKWQINSITRMSMNGVRVIPERKSAEWNRTLNGKGFFEEFGESEPVFGCLVRTTFLY